MAKYMVLYNSTESAADVMAEASPEKMKASMDEWMKWRDEASKIVKIEFVLPLQAVSRITPDGVTDSNNQTSGYSIMEGESKEAIIGLLRKHPHLKRSGTTIDLLEMMSMPGM